MRYDVVTIGSEKFKQINKTKARKLFATDVEIFLHPCNMNLHSPWSSLCQIKLDKEELKNTIEWHEKHIQENWEIKYKMATTSDIQFDNIVRDYESYNCIQELGKYSNFFIKL